MNKNLRSLTPTPPMGWNSFDCYGCAATENDIMDNLEAMAIKLKPYGYKYFVVDGGWYGEYNIEPGKKYPLATHAEDVNIDEYGRYIPSKCNFPNGIKRIADRAHELGLKFGIHLMRGISRKAVELNLPIKGTIYRAADIANKKSICVWCPHNYGVDPAKPGAQEFYDSIVELFASWGVDFIKADDITGHPGEIELLLNAIDKCDRDIVLSLSPGGQTATRRMATYSKANMLRTTTDVWDNREDINKAFDAWKRFQGIHIPGFWLDMDMIPFGHLQIWRPRPADGDTVISENEEFSGKGYERMSGLSDDQKRTFITMRALAASPLFMGGDLQTSDDFSLSLVTNRDMIECNQNGIMGSMVYQNNGVEVWFAPKKDVWGEGWIGVFNRNTEAIKSTLTVNELPMLKGDKFNLYDIWNQRNLGIFNGNLECEIGADGVLFLKYAPC